MGSLTNNEQGMMPVVHRDRARAQAIIDAIKRGETTKMAAEAGGIARRTLYEWIYKAQEVRAAREDDPDAVLTPFDDDYLWFLDHYEHAESERKRALLKRIEAAGEDPRRWQANAWLLERLHPDEFSLKQQVTYTERSDKDVFTLNIGGPPKRVLARAKEEVIDVTDVEIVDE